MHDNYGNVILCSVSPDYVSGSTGWVYGDSLLSVTFCAVRSGDDGLKLEGCLHLRHTYSGMHSNKTSRKVVRIVGIV